MNLKMLPNSSNTKKTDKELHEKKFEEVAPHLKNYLEQTKKFNPDITEVELNEKFTVSAKKYVYDLEKKRGLMNYWPFLIFGTAVLWILAYAMFGLMDIPGLKVSSLPFVIRLMIGCVFSWVGYKIMLQARKNYYFIRELKMQINEANIKLQDLLSKKVELDLREIAEKSNFA